MDVEEIRVEGGKPWPGSKDSRYGTYLHIAHQDGSLGGEEKVGSGQVRPHFMMDGALPVNYLLTVGTGIRPRVFSGLIENEQTFTMPIDPLRAI
jgi:hypothetical protein